MNKSFEFAACDGDLGLDLHDLRSLRLDAGDLGLDLRNLWSLRREAGDLGLDLHNLRSLRHGAERACRGFVGAAPREQTLQQKPKVCS